MVQDAFAQIARAVFSAAVWGIACLVVALGTQRACASDIQEVYNLGKRSLELGDCKAASEKFAEVLDQTVSGEKDYFIAMLGLGEAAYVCRKNTDAEGYANSIISGAEDQESKALAYNLRGRIMRRAGDEKKAVEDYTRAIKTRHDNPRVLAMSFAGRGIIYADLGKIPDAMSDFSKAAELDTSCTGAYAGRALAHMRSDQMDKAERDAKHALTLNPDTETRKLLEDLLNWAKPLKGTSTLIRVPLDPSGHVFVQVKMSPQGKPKRFLLDTGATYSLLSPETFALVQKETPLEKIGKGQARIADGSGHVVVRYRAKTAYLYDWPLGEMEFHVFEKPMPGIQNLLGIRALKGISLSIDHGSRQAELRRKFSSD